MPLERLRCGETLHHRPDTSDNAEHDNLISAKAMVKAPDAAIRIYPAAAVRQSRPGGKSRVLKALRRNKRLFEIKARRFVVTHREWEGPAPSQSRLTSWRNTRDVIIVHKLFGHPSVYMTRWMARAVGMRLKGAFIPCVQCQGAPTDGPEVPSRTSPAPSTRFGW